MFHIDATFEDIRLVANSQDGHDYAVLLVDGLSGKSEEITFSASQLGMILAFNLDPRGEPVGFEQFYAELEPLLAHLPKELRPIP